MNISGYQQVEAALQAHKTQLDAITQNIVHANTTGGVDGKAYQRQQVSFQAVLDKSLNPEGIHLPIAKVSADDSDGMQVYNPTHPHADPATGMVKMPNVKIHQEMVHLINATHANQAILSAARSCEDLARKTLSVLNNR